MKIALLCNGYGRVSRGAEQYTKMLYDHLSPFFDIDIWSIQDTGTRFRDDICFPWRNGRAYLEAAGFCRSWYQDCKESYDLVLNNSGFVGSYYCQKYRKKTGTPFVSFERGGGREEYLNFLFKPDGMVYLTEASRRRFHHDPSVKSWVLPIGIDLDVFQQKFSCDGLMDGLESPLFLSTSALVDFKRIDRTIDAVSSLDQGSLIQTSTGDKKDSLVAYGEKKLGSRFRYMGVVDRSVLLGLYKSCDVFVNASVHEAFGIVYLEAMASGLPVVTQNDLHRKEILGDAGFFVDCDDRVSYAEILDLAVHNGGERSLVQVKKFSWKNLIPRYRRMIWEAVA